MSNKIYLQMNVLEAAQERISYTFDNFTNIYVSFSGGKDSTVMLHLVLAEAKKRGRKVGVLFVDLEGQYRITIEHIEKTLLHYKGHITIYWVCLPLHLRNAVSVFEPFWICWDPDKKSSWIRTPPKIAITDINYFKFFRAGMEFEEFVPLFGEEISTNQLTACFVGIRTDESLNRFRTINSISKITHNGKQWTTKVTKNVYNIYPIYDWKTEDLWIYQGKNPNLTYNQLYDLMYKAGLSLSQMRICQPYGDDQRKGLWLFHLIEPETWSKVVARVNGANSGALYINEVGNINGYRTISKPEGHSWESFAKLLINSMPPITQKHYKIKIYKFIQWWEERGYKEGIPDEAPQILESEKNVPSWRRICKVLLRNDYWCKGLSFTQQKSTAYENYLNSKKNKQSLNLFGDQNHES